MGPLSFRNLDGFRGLYTETRLGPETPQVHPIKAWSLIKAPVKIQTPIKAPVATSTTRCGLMPSTTERFSQRQKKPDLGQALRPFLRNCTVLEQIPE